MENTNTTFIDKDKKTNLASSPGISTPETQEEDPLMWFKFETRIRAVIKDLIGPTIIRAKSNEQKVIKLSQVIGACKK